MYEVIPTQISVLVWLAKDDPSLALQSLTAFIRVNNAVFQKKMTRPNQALSKLTEQVVASPNTGVSRSFPGYKVTMTWTPMLGSMLYTIEHVARG